MAKKVQIKGIPRVTNYSSLSSFAGNVVTMMSNPLGSAFYLTPFPTLVNVSSAKLALDNAITAWGPVGARGSHSDLMILRSASLTLYNLLVQEAGYVLNTVIAFGGDYSIQSSNLILSGFGVKNPPTPQGLLGVPQNLHQWFKNSISIYHVGLRWKKPLNLTSPGNVKEYIIYRGNQDGFTNPTTSKIASSTRTSFIDKNPIVGGSSPTSFYWITAVNTAGEGAPTASLPVDAILV